MFTDVESRLPTCWRCAYNNRANDLPMHLSLHNTWGSKYDSEPLHIMVPVFSPDEEVDEQRQLKNEPEGRPATTKKQASGSRLRK